MSEQKKRIDITSADSKYIGFEYQYLYFMNKLINIKSGEEVGYESLDDVHLVTCSGKTVYFQLKHTIETAASGEQVNLTLFSEELWKTLSNWSELVSDDAEERNTVSKQMEFLESSEFIFVSNRKIDKNPLIERISKYKDKEIDFLTLLSYIKSLKQQTKSKTIQQYIDNFISLDKKVLKKYFQLLKFEDSNTDLFSEIRKSIMQKMIREVHVDDVLFNLYAQLKIEFFEKIGKHKHQVITYEEWRKKYLCVFEEFRTTCLPFREYTTPLPDHLEEQGFVKELYEIGALIKGEDDLAYIAEYTSKRLSAKKQLEDWHQDGHISLECLNRFHSDSISKWQNTHRAEHRMTRIDKKRDFVNALNCFDKTMEKELKIMSTDLGTKISNGEFLDLANEERIGWKYSWKEKYNQK
ncbi:MAG: hypothetical protein Q4D42_04165 [Eubacteriales bacterium]|nr:hypothetical protein [Eubacteriales bacterium]